VVCPRLLWDSDSRWIKDYVRKTEMCDAFHVEIWGMYLGLDMTWREHITHLIVESDLKVLVDLINDNCKFSGTISTLARSIRKLLN
jgi:poly(A) polymerase Pap1